MKLVHDAEPFADHLHRGAGAARGRFPAAEHQQPRYVEPGNGLDGFGQRGRDFGGFGKSAGRAVKRHQFERHFLRDGHHHLLELGFRAEADQPDFAAGRVLGQIGRLIKRVARPRIEDGGQHHFIFQRRPGRRRDRFQRLQRVRHNAAANDDLIAAIVLIQFHLRCLIAQSSKRANWALNRVENVAMDLIPKRRFSIQIWRINSPPNASRRSRRGSRRCCARVVGSRASNSTGRRRSGRIFRGRNGHAVVTGRNRLALQISMQIFVPQRSQRSG